MFFNSKRVATHCTVLLALLTVVTLTLAGKGGGKGGGGTDGGGTSTNFAFVYRDVFDGGLFLTTISGDITMRLTRPKGNSARDKSPEWSPDLDPDTPGYQGKIAFLRRDDNGVHFCVVDPNGKTLQVLQSFVNEGDPYPWSLYGNGTLTWSPNGKEIVFSSGGAMYAIDAVAGGYRFLGAGGLDPTISATRSQIAYWADGIYVVDFALDENGRMVLDQESVVNVTATPGSDEDLALPRWSPDGLFLAYTRFASDVRQVVVMELLDFTEMVVFEDSFGWGDGIDMDGRATWSPDGLQIGFHLGVLENVAAGPTWDIVRITDWWDPSHRQVVPVTTSTAANKREVDPDWCPGWVSP